jgi:hypothetical protein
VDIRLVSPIRSISMFWYFFQSRMSKQIRCCTMGSPQNARQGLWGNRSTGSNPQHAWDSFLSTQGIPEVPKENYDLRKGDVVSLCVDTEVEENPSEGHRLENTLPPQKIPWRRGRPRKNKEVGEHQNLVESCA